MSNAAHYGNLDDCVRACACACAKCLSDFALPSWPHSRTAQHVNGSRNRQSCHRGAGGAPGLWSRAPHTHHTQSEPHPVSACDTHHPVAGSSHSCSHEESQSHSLQHSLTHTVSEERLSPHTQSLSHGQGREESAGLCGDFHQAH